MKQPFGAEVFINVWPVHTLAGSDQPPVGALRRRCLGQSPGPRGRYAYDATVGKMRDDLVLGDLHILYERFAASHNVHAKPREYHMCFRMP